MERVIEDKDFTVEEAAEKIRDSRPNLSFKPLVNHVLEENRAEG